MNKKEFMNAIEDLLEMDPDTLTGDEALDDLEGWDSLAVISFIALVDEALGVILEGDKLAEAKSMAELLSLVDDKLS
ncbi:MAG: acyl carrier protein [Sphingomonadales bacterium]|nr:acyl carrier protein [Sphingomonadales bacterium]